MLNAFILCIDQTAAQGHVQLKTGCIKCQAPATGFPLSSAEKSSTKDTGTGKSCESAKTVSGGQRNQLCGKLAKLHSTSGAAPVAPEAAWRPGAGVPPCLP